MALSYRKAQSERRGVRATSGALGPTTPWRFRKQSRPELRALLRQIRATPSQPLHLAGRDGGPAEAHARRDRGELPRAADRYREDQLADPAPGQRRSSAVGERHTVRLP